MDRRGRLFCLSCYFIITVVGFLVALLVAYKTLTGECEHPEDICYNDGKCYFDYRGFICECSQNYYGDRCQYVRHLPAQSQMEVVLNGTKSETKSNYTISGQPVSYKSPNDTKAKNTKASGGQGQQEVQQTPVKRDQSLSPPYWRFVIIFGVINSIFFILAYAVYVMLDKMNCIQNRTKESFGIKYEQGPQAHQLLISNTSGLDA